MINRESGKMKLQVLQENFAKALSFSSRFISTKAALPVLGNILLSAKKTSLVVAATNLEIATTTTIGAQIKEEGEITIPGRTLTETVVNLNQGPLNLETEKEQLIISNPNFKSQILGMNASDFPKIPQSLDKTSSFALPNEDFLSALSKVLFAASVDETRPSLTGILFIFGKGSLSLVSSDGFRLSQKKIRLEQSKFEGRLILPKGGLSEIARLGDEESDVLFSFRDKDSQAIFGIGNVILATRIIEGEFPNFEKIIPKESLYKIVAEKEDLLRAVKLASIFARESANVIKIKIASDSLLISAESPQSGGQTTKIEANVEGSLKNKDVEIAFNYRFLEEFLGVVSGDEITIELSDKNSPGVFADPKDPAFLHLIMPVKIQE